VSGLAKLQIHIGLDHHTIMQGQHTRIKGHGLLLAMNPESGTKDMTGTCFPLKSEPRLQRISVGQIVLEKMNPCIESQFFPHPVLPVHIGLEGGSLTTCVYMGKTRLK